MNLTRISLFGLGVAALVTPTFAQSPRYVPGEILVCYKTGVFSAAKTKVAAAVSATLAEDIGEMNVQRLRVSPSKLDAALAKLKTDPKVLYAEKNGIKEKTFVPNDPQYFFQWHLQKVKAPQAWDLFQGSSLVTVAVIDDGAALNHEDLKTKLVAGHDFSDNDSDPSAAFGDDHGTHCAGLVGAETNNGKGVASVGNKVRVMPLRIFPNATDSNSALAIRWAADHGCKVISMSYGSVAPSNTESLAIDYAWSKGCVLVAAAGNNNSSTKFYPAAFPKVISVAATDPADAKASFSNFGNWVTVAAPGTDILSTVPGGYGTISGTSMACPIVASLAGLLYSYAPAGTTNTQIRAAIETTTDPVGSFVVNGRINAQNALAVFNAGVDTVSFPDAVATNFGTYLTGNAASLTALDGNSYRMQSVLASGGLVTSVEVSLALNGPSSGLTKSVLSVYSSGKRGGQTQIFIWNPTSSAYVYLGGIAVTDGAPARRDFNMTKILTPYVSAGHLKFLLKTIVPRQVLNPPPFIYQLDSITVLTR